MKVKGSLYWIYSFTSGCKGKMLVAILLAVIGVLCGMAPYFALAGILSGLIQNTLTAERMLDLVVLDQEVTRHYLVASLRRK